MHNEKPQSFWVNVFWTDEMRCSKSYQQYVHRCRIQGKEHCTYCETSGTACLESVQGTMNSQEMCCPVTESLVSVAGHRSSNRIMTQIMSLMSPGLNPVLCGRSWNVQSLQTWDSWSSLFRRSGPKYLPTGAGVSLTIVGFSFSKRRIPTIFVQFWAGGSLPSLPRSPKSGWMFYLYLS